jgi:hypothetical protein
VEVPSAGPVGCFSLTLDFGVSSFSKVQASVWLLMLLFNRSVAEQQFERADPGVTVMSVAHSAGVHLPLDILHLGP